MKKMNWKNFNGWQKVGISLIGLAQIGLFAAAWMDLRRRGEAGVHGSKTAWQLALFVSGIGPIAYFVKGRKPSDWTEAHMPDLTGKVAIVTGANRGIGYETTRALVQRGATVIMACRNRESAERSAEEIRALHPAGTITIHPLDLSDLNSVQQFTDDFKAKHNRLDLLINNAGLMVQPLRTTEQGFESQIGVNHLGHFALTAQLIGLLNATPQARVVTVSSIAHRFGTIDLADLHWQNKEYDAMSAYGQSKLANLMFTYELQRKLNQAGHSTKAMVVHPGYTRTNVDEGLSAMSIAGRLLAQPARQGALPSLFAATASEAQGGQYYGPSGVAELGGNPEQVASNELSYDRVMAERLWQVSEELTGVSFQL